MTFDAEEDEDEEVLLPEIEVPRPDSLVNEVEVSVCRTPALP